MKAFLITLGVISFVKNTYSEWSPDIRITRNDSISGTPRIVIDKKNKIHIFWQDDREGKWDIYYNWWDKGSIGIEQNLTPDIRGASMSPEVDVIGDTIHLVWMDNRDGNWEIYYKNSINRGKSWSISMRLTNNEGISFWPVIKSDGEKLHLVWSDGKDGYSMKLYYKYSENGGASWSQEIALTSDTFNSQFPQMIVSKGVIHIVYYKADSGGIWEVYYKRSPDGGISWESEVKLVSNGWSVVPSITANGDTVFVVWQDCRDKKYKIYYRYSIDKGITWNAEKNLTEEDEIHDMFPTVTSLNGEIYVVWQRYFYGDLDIWYGKLRDLNGDWEIIPLIKEKTNSALPYIINSELGLYIGWCDRRDGNWEIYFKGYFPSWKVQLIAEASFATDTLNFAGIEFSATDSFDVNYDFPEPPPSPSNYIQLYFPHPEWQIPVNDNFRTDIRAPIDLTDTLLIYKFEVNTDRLDENINIKAIPFDVPEEYGIYIVDIETGIMQDMRTIPVYSYNSGIGGIHKFELWIGKPKRKLYPGWTQISVPVIPDDPNPNTIFQEYVTPYWIYTYDQQGGYTPPDSIRIGYGYWIGVNDTCFIDAKGEKLSQNTTYELPLKAIAWNLIGCPFYSSILLDSIKVMRNNMIVDMRTAGLLGWVQPILYTYTSGIGYTSSLFLTTWQGYWFAALEECTLLINKSSGIKEKKFCSSQENWSLIFNAKYGNEGDSITELGVREDATDGFDNQYDFLEPPTPPGDYVSAYFPRPEWDFGLGEKFNRDIRAPINDNGSKSWTFTVVTSGVNQVVLSWPQIEETPKNLEFVLVDLDSDIEINMREKNFYEYVSNGIHNFKIRVKSKVGTEYKERRYIFTLNAPKPNPSLGCIEISYSIAQKCEVKLAIYDLSGRLVKVLERKEKSPGCYTIIVDNKELVSGIYFVNLKTPKFEAVKKLILVK